MNVLKIQQEALKALFTAGNIVSYFNYDTDHVFITLNARVGYIVPSDELRIDLRDAQAVTDIITDQIEEAMHPSNRLIGTDEYRIGGTVRKYVWAEEEDRTAYFDTGLLKNFSNPELYKSRRHTASLAVVTEHGIGSDERKVVGIVMPYRIEE